MNSHLARAGLSITEWKPIVGALPPLSDADWEVEFDKYKKSPEYIKYVPIAASVVACVILACAHALALQAPLQYDP